MDSSIIIVSYVFLLLVVILGIIIHDILRRIKKVKEEIRTVKEKVPLLKQAFELACQENEMNYKRYESLTKRYENLVDSLLKFKPTVDVEKFMSDVLNLGIELIPEADAGSVILKEKNTARYVALSGMSDGDILKSIELKLDWFKKPKKDIEIYENILGYEENPNIPADVKLMLKKAAGRWIYRTMGGKLQIEEDVTGYIFLDAMSDREFSEESKKVMRFLIKLSNMYLALKKLLEKNTLLQKDMITSVIKMLEMRDPYTKGHSERVANYSEKIAESLNLSSEDVDKVYWAGILHDIGKLGIPDYILNKPGKLKPDEFEMIKMHPVYGEKAVSRLKYLKSLAPIIRYHHERWDGKGYPDGLKGEEIPLLSRILAISDAFDAMTSARAYRDPMDPVDAFKEIKENAGKQFDPNIVERINLSIFFTK